MSRVLVTPAAVEDVQRLIVTHSLPPDTVARLKRSLLPLASFPLLGAPLAGRWEGFRFVLGPWRWLIAVYVFDEERDQVSIVTFQDARSSRSPTSAR